MVRQLPSRVVCRQYYWTLEQSREGRLRALWSESVAGLEEQPPVGVDGLFSTAL